MILLGYKIFSQKGERSVVFERLINFNKKRIQLTI